MQGNPRKLAYLGLCCVLRAVRRDQERVGEPAPIPIPALEIVWVTHYCSLLISVTPWGLSRRPLRVYGHVCSTSTGVP